MFRFRITASPWSQEQFFYTRRIGRAPQLFPDSRGGYASSVGETTILGAAKVQGKTPSGWTIGALAALTSEETASVVDGQGAEFRDVIEPRTAYGVARLARDFRNGRTVFGLFGTVVHRDLPETVTSLRSDALAAGFEMQHRFGNDQFLARATAMGSRVSGSAAAITATQRSSVHYFQRPDIGVRDARSGRDVARGLRRLSRDPEGCGHLALWRPGQHPFPRLRAERCRVPDQLGAQHRAGVDHPALASAGQGIPLLPAPAESVARLGLRRQEHSTSASSSSGTPRSRTTRRSTSGPGRISADWTMRRCGAARPSSGPENAWIGGAFNSDPRKAVRLSVDVNHWNNFDGIGHGNSIGAMLSWRPSGRLDLSAGPRYESELPSRQFVAKGTVGGSTEYVVGDLSQKTVSLATRGNFTFTPSLTFQLYAEPFISSGRFLTFKRVLDPARIERSSAVRPSGRRSPDPKRAARSRRISIATALPIFPWASPTSPFSRSARPRCSAGNTAPRRRSFWSGSRSGEAFLAGRTVQAAGQPGRSVPSASDQRADSEGELLDGGEIVVRPLIKEARPDQGRGSPPFSRLRDAPCRADPRGKPDGTRGC